MKDFGLENALLIYTVEHFLIIKMLNLLFFWFQGRTHSEQYKMWSEGSFASDAVKKFAEDGDTSGFDFEAQAYGGVRDIFTAAPIKAGLGKTATNFITDGSHTKVGHCLHI